MDGLEDDETRRELFAASGGAESLTLDAIAGLLNRTFDERLTPVLASVSALQEDVQCIEGNVDNVSATAAHLENRLGLIDVELGFQKAQIEEIVANVSKAESRGTSVGAGSDTGSLLEGWFRKLELKMMSLTAAAVDTKQTTAVERL